MGVGGGGGLRKKKAHVLLLHLRYEHRINMTDPLQGLRPTEDSRLRCLYLITAFPRCLRCPIGLLLFALPAALSTPIGRACTGMLSPVLSLFFFYLVHWGEFFYTCVFFFSLSLIIPCIILLSGSFMHSAFGYLPDLLRTVVYPCARLGTR